MLLLHTIDLGLQTVELRLFVGGQLRQKLRSDVAFPRLFLRHQQLQRVVQIRQLPFFRLLRLRKKIALLPRSRQSFLDFVVIVSKTQSNCLDRRSAYQDCLPHLHDLRFQRLYFGYLRVDLAFDFVQARPGLLQTVVQVGQILANRRTLFL